MVHSLRVTVNPQSFVMTRLDSRDLFEFECMSNPSTEIEGDAFRREKKEKEKR